VIRLAAGLFAFLCLCVGQAFAQGNGRLQIHYMDVGQGDGAVLISPLGEVVLFDNGVSGQCGKPLGYLQSLGITKIDYHIASHYHSDHVGCTAQILNLFPLTKKAYDRGGSYTTTAYNSYVTAVGAKRATATPGMMITLDSTALQQVQILFVASNANGIPTTDENDRSLVTLVRFGHFEAEFGGDLSGANTGVADPDPNDPSPTPPPPPPGGNTCSRPAGAPQSATAVCNDGTYSSSQNRSGTCSSHSGVRCWICPGVLCNGLVAAATPVSSFVPDFWNGPSVSVVAPSYADVESSIAPAIGQIEVYKVHHHGSKNSSNTAWLNATRPKVGIVSVGIANTYGHPTSEALNRLHGVGAITYWTSAGKGAGPIPGQDVVAGDVVVEVAAGAQTFSVNYGSITDTYPMWGFTLPPTAPSGPPIGVIDTPAANSVVAGEVAFTGWAIDDSGIAGVDVYRSPMPGEPTQPNGLVYVGTAAQIEGARPDVEAAFPLYPQVNRAGWGFMILSNFLPNSGNGPVTLHAVARSVSGESAVIASRTIITANANSPFPFGTIDTPGQGATVSGFVTNFGWALTSNPKMIPVDGSTISVYIDGVMVGHPSYNHFRPDIAAAFPGYANSNGAVGFYQFDSTTLTNGLHTISWTVQDSAGALQGIGSRYFRVQNP
jgi:beta-lactamase superfamily II metal-dependent hydrolase